MDIWNESESLKWAAGNRHHIKGFYWWSLTELPHIAALRKELMNTSYFGPSVPAHSCNRAVCRDCFSNILLNSNLLSFSPVWMNYQFFSSAFLLIFPEIISGMRDTVPEISVQHRLCLVEIVIFFKSKVCQKATSKVTDSLWDAFVLWFCCICLQKTDPMCPMRMDKWICLVGIPFWHKWFIRNQHYLTSGQSTLGQWMLKRERVEECFGLGDTSKASGEGQKDRRSQQEMWKGKFR